MAKRNKRRVSCLGALLILCMLLIAGVTAAVNLLMNNGKMLKVSDKYFFYYDRDDMGSTIPKGSFIIAEEAKEAQEMNAVIYKTTAGDNRVAIVSLKLDRTDDGTPASTVYYLTTIADPEAIAVSPSDIIGICKQKNKEFGTVIGFLLGMPGMVTCLLLPCFILLLYLIAAMVSSRDKEADMEEIADDEADIDFVKSIQQRQQKAAERDAKRLEEKAPAAEKKPLPFKPMDEEQLQREEEEEAARRAERIAAVRSHMETRRETETPDGVPLYTTEFITKTHTMPIPKTGTEKLTVTAQRAAVKLSATGRLMSDSAVRPAVKPEAPAAVLTEPERLPVHAKKAAESPKPAAPEASVKPAAPAKPAAAPVRAAAPKPAVQPVPQPAEDPATFDEVWAMLEAEEQKLQ